MRVDTTTQNPALVNLLAGTEETITLDANFLIPPSREGVINKGFSFSRFQSIWLEPVFSHFGNLAIHESVYQELVSKSLREFIDTLLLDMPAGLSVWSDSDLTDREEVIRNTIEAKIYPFTEYDPLLDNHQDRGEVKSLAYIATKNLPYFASHDSNTLRIIDHADEWDTGISGVKAIRFYEVIYYLLAKKLGDRRSLRMLYKYLYYLTAFEKKTNPDWKDFQDQMEELYPSSC